MIQRGFRVLVRVLVIGVPVSVALSAMLALRGQFAAYSGGTIVSFDFASDFEPGWLMTVDERGWGWSRRARAVVSPNS